MKSRTGLRFSVLAVLLLAVTACSHVAPIYNVKDHPVPAVAQKLSLDEIQKSIMVAGAQRNWRFEPVGPGVLKGRYSDGKHEAIINVAFSQTAYSISLVSTENLREGDGTVHRTFNRWVHTLERDIENRLYQAGLARG